METPIVYRSPLFWYWETSPGILSHQTLVNTVIMIYFVRFMFCICLINVFFLWHTSVLCDVFFLLFCSFVFINTHTTLAILHSCTASLFHLDTLLCAIKCLYVEMLLSEICLFLWKWVGNMAFESDLHLKLELSVNRVHHLSLQV